MIEATFGYLGYGVTLNRPDLRLVDLGKPGNPILVPPELCEIPPFQPFRNMLPPEASKNMIAQASKRPHENAARIVDTGFGMLGFKPIPETSILPGFGVTVSDSMTVIPGRVLEAPTIVYNGKETAVTDAKWNLIKTRFYHGAETGEWAVLLIKGSDTTFAGARDPGLRGFLQAFTAMCRNCGMSTPPQNYQPDIWETRDLRNAPQFEILKEIRDTMDRGIRWKRPSFLLVLLPDDKQTTYAGIKRFGDVDFGLHTVCMIVKNARDPKRQTQIFANVALKVNAKLGGTNHVIDDQSMEWLTEKSTMLIGIGQSSHVHLISLRTYRLRFGSCQMQLTRGPRVFLVLRPWLP